MMVVASCERSGTGTCTERLYPFSFAKLWRRKIKSMAAIRSALICPVSGLLADYSPPTLLEPRNPH